MPLTCWPCQTPLVASKQDRRWKFCPHCNVNRCGHCGDGLAFTVPGNDIREILDWLIPRKILALLVSEPFQTKRGPWTCTKCLRKYPALINLPRYFFWEIKIAWWNFVGKNQRVSGSTKALL